MKKYIAPIITFFDIRSEERIAGECIQLVEGKCANGQHICYYNQGS